MFTFTAILSTKSSLKRWPYFQRNLLSNVGHTFNEIFFQTLAILSRKSSLKRWPYFQRNLLSNVGHTFNKIFFQTLAILSRKSSLKRWPYFQRNLLSNVGHTFNEIFFETRGTRGNSLRKLRTFEVFLDFFGGCSTSGGDGTTFFKFHETYLICTLNFSNF